MKESLSFMPEGWRVPRLWMRRISCRLRLSLLPEMGQRARIFISHIPQYQVQRIQRVLNAAARLIYHCPRFSHITPVLRSLHWLPVKFRVDFKIALLVYKALNNMAPMYISDMLIPKHSSDRWKLRSDDQGLLHIPKTNCKTLGDRAFAHAAPQLWNSLPLNVRKCENISDFKKRLKTFLFNKAYNFNRLNA